MIQHNRQKLLPIVTLVFCATHDLAIRGKTEEFSIFKNLLEFRVDAGDNVLKEYLEACQIYFTPNSK